MHLTHLWVPVHIIRLFHPKWIFTQPHFVFLHGIQKKTFWRIFLHALSYMKAYYDQKVIVRLPKPQKKLCGLNFCAVFWSFWVPGHNEVSLYEKISMNTSKYLLLCSTEHVWEDFHFLENYSWKVCTLMIISKRKTDLCGVIVLWDVPLPLSCMTTP